jgi:hypothetical protein
VLKEPLNGRCLKSVEKSIFYLSVVANGFYFFLRSKDSFTWKVFKLALSFAPTYAVLLMTIPSKLRNGTFVVVRVLLDTDFW